MFLCEPLTVVAADAIAPLASTRWNRPILLRHSVTSRKAPAGRSTQAGKAANLWCCEPWIEKSLRLNHLGPDRLPGISVVKLPMPRRDTREHPAPARVPQVLSTPDQGLAGLRV